MKRNVANVKRCRAEVAAALCAFFMHNSLIYSQKYVANARKRSYIWTSMRILDSCSLSSFLFLSFTYTSFAHLRDLHKSRKREGGAKSKVQHRRSAGINHEGRIPVPFTTASRAKRIPSERRKRRSLHGEKANGAAWKMCFIANKIEAISDFISVVYIETMIRLRSRAQRIAAVTLTAQILRENSIYTRCV